MTLTPSCGWLAEVRLAPCPRCGQGQAVLVYRYRRRSPKGAGLAKGTHVVPLEHDCRKEVARASAA